MARNFSAVFAVLAVLTAAPPADATQAGANQLAYNSAIKCLVANSRAKSMRLRVGDETGAARYDTQARKTFDVAVRLGRGIGLSNERINGDLDAMMDRELPLMVQDNAYFRQTVADCRTMGLM
ncbi:hypothetical protein [Caulobacter mirabilis]|uniref:hypothetical protein n=1 Tax=Caulobacter mirabilis TaxID=69666 RepID=UPI0012370D71|nr:hypothetical protein [Caulobacter mirabilis]